MPGISQVITTKNWEKWHFCDAPLNFTFSIWNLNLVLGPHVQTNWKPATKSRYDRFCIFSDRYFGHISRTKNKKLKRPAFSLWAGAWSTSCPKITPKYVKTWAGHGQSTSLAVTWLAQLVDHAVYTAPTCATWTTGHTAVRVTSLICSAWQIYIIKWGRYCGSFSREN